jgi:hypothetical protein
MPQRNGRTMWTITIGQAADIAECRSGVRSGSIGHVHRPSGVPPTTAKSLHRRELAIEAASGRCRLPGDSIANRARRTYRSGQCANCALEDARTRLDHPSPGCGSRIRRHHRVAELRRPPVGPAHHDSAHAWCEHDSAQPEASNIRVRDRVFHNKFGHGTVAATNGPKLTIEFDDGGVKRVLDGFVVRSNEAPPPD